MKKLLLLLSVLAILFACTTEDYVSQPENGEIADGLSGGDKMEMITLPSGIVVGKVGDMYIFEGDIILSPEQLDALSSPQTRGTIDISVLLGIRKWPDGKVYYTINNNCPVLLREKINTSIAEYHAKTSIRFMPRTNQTDYVEFTTLNNNSGYITETTAVGRLGGKQEVYLNANSSSKRDVVHAMAHVVGLLHENSRTDRDEYLIFTRSSHQFTAPAATPHGPFNFNSVTMYPGIDRVDGHGHTTAIDRLSYGDIAAIQAMYGYSYIPPLVEPTITFSANGVPHRNGTTLYTNTAYNIEFSFSDPDLMFYDHYGNYGITVWKNTQPWINHSTLAGPYYHLGSMEAGAYNFQMEFGGRTVYVGFNVVDRIYAKTYAPPSPSAGSKRNECNYMVYFYNDPQCTQQIDFLPRDVVLTFSMYRIVDINNGTPVYEHMVTEERIVPQGSSSEQLLFTTALGVFADIRYGILGCD